MLIFHYVRYFEVYIAEMCGLVLVIAWSDILSDWCLLLFNGRTVFGVSLEG